MPISSFQQLQIPFSFTFSLPENGSCHNLDLWLDRILYTPVADVFAAEDNRFDDVVTMPVRWLQRCLLLAMELLRIAQVPVFSPPRINNCVHSAAQPHKWQAKVTLPLVDLLPRASYDKALRHAIQLCHLAAASTPTQENFQRLDAIISKHVLILKRGLSPLGKNTLILLQAAYQLGIPFTHLGGWVFQLGWGSNAKRIERTSTIGDCAFGSRLACSKVYSTALLRNAGLPAPVHVEVSTTRAACIAADTLGWPVVVKPADLDRGEGVSVDLVNELGLITAFNKANRLSRSKKVIVEKQLEGVCHRLFIAHGRLLYAVKRLPFCIKGDSIHSITELIDAEWKSQQALPPWKRSAIQPFDNLARAAIADVGYDETSIPGEGALVPLRRIESTAWGGFYHEVTGEVHQENIRIALAATSLFSLDVAGIDLISKDITKPWFENNGAIIEVNFCPSLGSNEVSRKYVQPYLENLMDGDGRIAIEVFCGGESAEAAAQLRQHSYVAEGGRCVLTSGTTTLTDSGEVWQMPFSQLYHRVRALVLSDQVDAIILVVQNDDLLDTGLPLEGVDRVEWIDDDLTFASSPGTPLTIERRAELFTLLEGWMIRYEHGI